MYNYTDMRDAIFQQIVVPDYRREVAEVVTWRQRWRKIASFSEGIAQCFVGMSTLLAFAAGFFDSKYLSFAAGCCSTVCIVLLRYSTYAENESAERNGILARLLTRIGIAPMPAITADAPDEDQRVVLDSKAIESDSEVAEARQSEVHFGRASESGRAGESGRASESAAPVML